MRKEEANEEVRIAGTNALLNVCDADKVCCGFKPSAADPHRKLLRSESSGGCRERRPAAGGWTRSSLSYVLETRPRRRT